MPKRLERLPRYYQRREDNGLMRSRVRVRVPAPLIGWVLNDDGNAVRNQILRVQDRQPVRGTDHVLATARATVVLSIPPNPTVVSRRWLGSREGASPRRPRADHSRCRERQIMHRRPRDCLGKRGLRWPPAANRGDEIVAPARDADDVATAVLSSPMARRNALT